MSDYQQESLLRSLDNAHRLLELAGARGLRHLRWSRRKATTNTTPAASARAACWPGGWSKPGRGSSKSRPNTFRSSTGTRTTTATTRSIGMKKEIDRPIAQLILDLEARGLLDRTLVVLASEFSRDMMIEGMPGSRPRTRSTFKVDTLEELKHYGLHRHFTGASSRRAVRRRHETRLPVRRIRAGAALSSPIEKSRLRDATCTPRFSTAMGINPQTAFEVESRPVLCHRRRQRRRRPRVVRLTGPHCTYDQLNQKMQRRIRRHSTAGACEP